LIALRAARARGIAARFIDLPSTAREMGLEEGTSHPARCSVMSGLSMSAIM
jgi:hypothetical protein